MLKEAVWIFSAIGLTHLSYSLSGKQGCLTSIFRVVIELAVFSFMDLFPTSFRIFFSQLVSLKCLKFDPIDLRPLIRF